MTLFGNAVINMPVARIVFEDSSEFAAFEDLAATLGMGKDWPLVMLRDYLESYQESVKVAVKKGGYAT